jgi:protein-S-isoprenylcysteine O-methyltransferase Ste14
VRRASPTTKHSHQEGSLVETVRTSDSAPPEAVEARPPGSSTMLKVAPPVWALIYVLATLAISWSLGWPGASGLPTATLGVALVAIGFIPPVWAFAVFRREGTEINPTSITNRKLVTRVPYRFTRNPMYLGLCFLTLGIAFWVDAWPMFVAPIAVFATTNWIHIPFEEAKMRRQHGAAFEDYCRQVRRWL